MLIDTHCHLDDVRLYDRLPKVLAAAVKCGVQRLIVPGVEPQGWARIMTLARADERILAAPGVHPMKADYWSQDAAGELQKLTPALVAIGEIGLDYSPGMPSHELQKEVFRAQLQLARTAHLPVLIHCRQAFADTLHILAEERIREFGGVMHAFSGSLEIARECLALGLKIGIAGSVTWHNAIRPVAVVSSLPLEHLLLETDAPDLSPESRRGQINEPAFLTEIAAKVAQVKGVSVDEVAAITSGNALSLFRLPC